MRIAIPVEIPDKICIVAGGNKYRLMAHGEFTMQKGWYSFTVREGMKRRATHLMSVADGLVYDGVAGVFRPRGPYRLDVLYG